jgi:hypothetical protein
MGSRNKTPDPKFYVYADFGDEWQWIADEINAFKASLEIMGTKNQARSTKDI